ncbi:MAG: Amuc_1102 family pilus-like protein [Kiritimatiellia bacterium]|jgi:hypothetical protein
MKSARRLAWSAVVLAMAGFIGGELLAQRPAGRAAATAGEAEKDVVVIRKLTGMGPEGKAKTPDYSVSPSENSRAKDWAKVTVFYDTETEWIDELEFRYTVVVKHPKTGAFTLFPCTVAYIDIAKGRNHMSTVFLRPNTVERYGELERIAVEIYSKGELLTAAGLPDTPPQWWRLPMTNVRTMPGVLLNRSQTPFAFVGWDNYETIKGR